MAHNAWTVRDGAVEKKKGSMDGRVLEGVIGVGEGVN